MHFLAIDKYVSRRTATCGGHFKIGDQHRRTVYSLLLTLNSESQSHNARSSNGRFDSASIFVFEGSLPTKLRAFHVLQQGARTTSGCSKSRCGARSSYKDPTLRCWSWGGECFGTHPVTAVLTRRLRHRGSEVSYFEVKGTTSINNVPQIFQGVRVNLAGPIMDALKEAESDGT